MLSRRIARPLLASWFVAEGVEAFRRPGPHVERMRDAWRRLADRLDIPQPPSTDTLRTVVKVHGGATAAAAVLLALGRAPRSSAAALVVLTVPLAVMDAPSRGEKPTPQAVAAEEGRGTRPFLRDLSLIGGAAIAALDTQGRPSLGWRFAHARVDRDAELAARRAVSSARKEAKGLAREARSALRRAGAA